MAIGELQVKPDEFWRLTNGELMAILRGYVIRGNKESANHRNLYTLFWNANKSKDTSTKLPKDLWPLDIDYDGSEMSMEEKQKLFSKIANNDGT